MTRYHGITEDTYDQIVIDSGAVYYDFTDLETPGTLLGATRGGAVFTRKPKYVDLKYEGIVGKVKGGKVLVGVEVTLEVSIITLNDTNLPLSIPNSTDSSSGGYKSITEEEWHVDDVHVLDNIALVAERANGGDPVIITLSNPLCESDLTLPFKDKAETVSKWKFTAFYDPEALSTAPWGIDVPLDVIVFDRFVACSGSYLYSAYTADSVTWTQGGNLPASRSWYAMAYGNGVFVLVATGTNKMAYSTDGSTTWLEGDMPTTGNWQSVCWGNGKFVALAYGSSNMAYSSDGITWTLGSLPSSANWRAVCWGVDKFVAVSYSSTAGAYSSDGVTWSAMTLPNARTWHSITYQTDRFVVTGNNTTYAMYSTTGTSWTEGSYMPSYGAWWVTSGLGLFVSVKYNSSSAAHSTDGISWTTDTLPQSGLWIAVAFGNGRFVAIAYNGTFSAYSTDGINWTAGGTIPISVGRPLTYG